MIANRHSQAALLKSQIDQIDRRLKELEKSASYYGSRWPVLENVWRQHFRRLRLHPFLFQTKVTWSGGTNRPKTRRQRLNENASTCETTCAADDRRLLEAAEEEVL